MHIGINATRFSVDEPGGAIHVGIQTTNALCGIQDIDTTVFGHASARSRVQTPTLRDPLNISRSRLFGMVWERTILPVEATRCNIDILYSPNANGPLFETPFSNVICIHDGNTQRGYSNRIYQRYKDTIVPRTADIADAVVTVSDFSKKEIQEAYRIPESKIHVVYNGVDPIFYNSSPGDYLNLPDDFVLYVGAMNPRKNIDGLVSAYEKLKSTREVSHKLVLIGPKNTAAFADMELDVSDDIIFPGYVSKEQLKFAYEAADAFVFPSSYEGFGLPPLEAMACGTPVIASDAPALPEVLGDAASFVSPHDHDQIAAAIYQVLVDKNHRSRLVEKGEKRAQEFTWESAADQLIEVFTKIK